MTEETDSFKYGRNQIEFAVERRDRSTLEISVLPSGSVLVVAPVSAATDAIAAAVSKRARWIHSQQKYFSQFTPHTPPRRYVPGETHLYLGRQYRLKVGQGAERQVRLLRGYIQVDGVSFNDNSAIQKLVVGWYRKRARAQFHRRLEICRMRFSSPDAFVPSELGIKTMTSRWGSMSRTGRLLLNPDLVRASVDSIDYVITHELCHMAVPNHSRSFYELQERVMPDWEQRKLKLEKFLA